MDLPVIFDVALGIIIIYFISSLVLSFIMEYIIVRRNWRGEFLYSHLKNMFYSSHGGMYNIIEKVYRHPLVTKTQQYPYRKPESIDKSTFSKAFLHILNEIGEEENNTANKGKGDIQLNISKALENENYLDGDGKSIIESLFLNQINDLSSQKKSSNQNDISPLEEAQLNLENWYTGFENRLNYLFKREVKWFLFIYGFMLCLLLNIDTINIYNKLLTENDTRERMVMLGTHFASQHYDTIKNNIDKELKMVEKDIQNIITTHKISTDNVQQNNDPSILSDSIINLIKVKVFAKDNNIYQDGYRLIGWNDSDIKLICKNDKINPDWIALIWKLFGILISSFALMYGAPFWYEYIRAMVAARRFIQAQPTGK